MSLDRDRTCTEEFTECRYIPGTEITNVSFLDFFMSMSPSVDKSYSHTSVRTAHGNCGNADGPTAGTASRTVRSIEQFDISSEIHLCVSRNPDKYQICEISR